MVTVTVAPQMLTQVGGSDSLFVAIIDAAGGPPYAVQRLTASELGDGQVVLTLGDLNAMLPERTLSAARAAEANLIVTARISKSGNAISEAGDLSASPAVLTKTTQSVTLEIDHVVK